MIQILAIAPYEGLAESIQALGQNQTDFQITVKVGNLQAGVEIAKESLYKNYDIVLSRGGTAHLLRQELDIPVIEVNISVYDILRAIKSVENYSDKFAIVGYDNITQCAHTLCDLLKYQIDIFTIDANSDVTQTLIELKKENYHMVLCDMIASVSAHQLGINSILITSGPESIQNAFHDAVQYYHSLKFANMQKEMFKNLIFESDLNVLLFNNNKNLILSSFKDSSDELEITQYICQHISSLSEQPDMQAERKFKSYLLSLRGKQFFCQGELFFAVYVQKKESISYSSANGIYTYNATELSEQELFNYCGSACYVGSLHSTISDYSVVTSPVLIIGEAGTGKDKTATLLFETGKYRENLFHIIDCKLISAKKWRHLLESDSSPFCSLHATIYLKNIHSLSEDIASKLIAFFKDSDICKRNRMIFSILEEEYDTHLPFIDYLTNQLTCLSLKIPPLRERKEQIPSIVSICINQLNAMMGKTIIGFDEEAMKLLQSFSWPQNLSQFKRVLKELAVLTHTPYISKETTWQHLKKEGYILPPSSPSAINLHQTLDEINYDIVRQILAEENGNQSKTARRLGISRSTLWRMLRLHPE